MKNYKWIIIAATIIGTASFMLVLSYNANHMIETVPQNYIACFKGETSKVEKSTYVYEKTNGKKTKYSYINTIVELDENDDSIRKEQIIKKGKIKKKKDIAKANGANSYVITKPDNTIYELEDFKEIWK